MIKDADEVIKEYGNLITWDDIKKARESERGVREWSELHKRSVDRFTEFGPRNLPPGMSEFEWEDVMSLGYICWQMMRSAGWYGEGGDTLQGFAQFNGTLARFGMAGMNYTMWCFNELQFFYATPEKGFDEGTKKERSAAAVKVSKELFEEHCGAIKDWLKKETKLNDLWGSLLDLTMADVELQTGEKELLKIAADIWGVPNDL